MGMPIRSARAQTLNDLLLEQLEAFAGLHREEENDTTLMTLHRSLNSIPSTIATVACAAVEAIQRLPEIISVSHTSSASM